MVSIITFLNKNMKESTFKIVRFSEQKTKIRKNSNPTQPTYSAYLSVSVPTGRRLLFPESVHLVPEIVKLCPPHFLLVQNLYLFDIWWVPVIIKPLSSEAMPTRTCKENLVLLIFLVRVEMDWVGLGWSTIAFCPLKESYNEFMCWSLQIIKKTIL